jgi:protein required for attachment to host cells
VLDLKGLDLEGVTKLVLDGEHLSDARNQGERRQDAAQNLRNLLGHTET